MRWWYLLAWGGLAAQRLREMRLSRRLERGLQGPVAGAATFPFMVAAHLGLFVLPPLESFLLRGRPRAARWWGLLLLTASGLRWWSISCLGDQWNIRAVVPPDLRPVERGPYRYVRHPNYLAVIVEFAALPMAMGAWRSAIGLSLLNGAVLVDRIRAEEMLLARAPGYQAAFARRARFIPGVF